MAQSDTSSQLEFFKLSFEDILETNIQETDEETVKIATQTLMSVRESPGIISIISKEDIEISGAQDLMEVLRLVPGIDFGSDVQNVIGISIRGNWASEGKVLITMDGQMLNETSYGSFSFAQRIPTDHIERVEIIRGPGSAIYGGVAGLAVINIVTKTGKEIQGISTSQSLSFAGGRAKQITQFQLGDVRLNELSFHLSGSHNEGKFSNRTFTSPNGTRINYRDSSQITSYLFNTGIQYKNFDIQYIFNDYRSDIIESEGNTHFWGHYVKAQYSIPINTSLSITPQMLYTRHGPWDLENVPENNYNATNTRYTGKIQLQYEPNRIFSMVSGIENFYDRSDITTPFLETHFNNNRSEISFNNFALYNQAIIHSKMANLTMGIRMDSHSAFGIAFAPRFGVTKVVDKWHVKLLYSNAFKAPTLQNLNANPEISPERINTSEFEVGYQINPSTTITANFFNIKINNNIEYEAIDNIIDHYYNGDGSGSTGGEFSYVEKFKWGSLKANYSYYFPTNRNKTEAFSALVIFPAHKAVFQSDYKINRHLFISSSFVFFSEKNIQIPHHETFQIINLKPSLQGNISTRWKNLLLRGFDGSIGINNLFNSNYGLIHPFETTENPIPSQGREISLRFLFTFHQ